MAAASVPAKRSFGLRVLGVLGKLFALAGTAALTFQFGARGLAAGLLFGFVIPWMIALRPKLAPRRDPFRTHGVRPLKWRVQVRFWPILSGLLAGIGTVVVLQQFSIEAMSSALLIRGLVGGLLGGVLIPSISWWFAVRRINRQLGRPMNPAPAAAAALIAFALVLLPAGLALAEVSGEGCGAALNGVNAGLVDSTVEEQAVPVRPGDTVVFVIASEVPAVDGEFNLHYGPFSIPIGGQVERGTEIIGTAEVDDYDWMGGGLYRITGEAQLEDGRTCSGAMMVDIILPEPLETLAGAIAATFAGAGVLGMFGSSLHDSLDARRSMRRYRDALQASSPGGAIGSGGGAGAAVAASGMASAATGMADAGRAEGEFMVTAPTDSSTEEAAAAGALAGAAAAATRTGTTEDEEDAGLPPGEESTSADGTSLEADGALYRTAEDGGGARGDTGEGGPAGETGTGEGPGTEGELAGEPSRAGARGPGDTDRPGGGVGGGGPVGEGTLGGGGDPGMGGGDTGMGGGAAPAGEPGGAAPELEFQIRDELGERVLDPGGFEHEVAVPPGDEDDDSAERAEGEAEREASDPDREDRP